MDTAPVADAARRNLVKIAVERIFVASGGELYGQVRLGLRVEHGLLG